MKRKDLHALFNEVSSRVSPIRGIYQTASTERERKIVDDMEAFLDNSLSMLEKDALERLFLSSLDKIETEDTMKRWYDALCKHYSPENIPDVVYIRIMGIISQKKFTSVQKLISKHKQHTS